jgi:hypothetical protein
MQPEIGNEDSVSLIRSKEWRCRLCSIVFDSRGKRNTHQRRVHQKAIMMSTTEAAVAVERGNDGVFRCSCGKGYQSAQSMARHRRNCDIATDVLEAIVLDNPGMNYKLEVLTVGTEPETESGSPREEMDGIEQEVIERIPILIDHLYNLAVCDECGIGIPFEWLKNHLKDNHGIKRNWEEVREALSLNEESMTFDEARNWIKTVWVGRAIQGIPIIDGIKCRVRS